MSRIVSADGGKSKEFERRLSGDCDALESVLRHVGEFGLYQNLLFLAMAPFAAAFAFVYLVQIFIVITPKNFWCRVPELAQLNDPELRRNLTTPPKGKGDWERCAMYKVDYSQVLKTLKPPPKNTPLQPCKHGWEFDLKDIPYPTIVTEFGWVCKKAKYGPLAQTIFFLGSITGGVLFGWIADKFGRVPALIGSNLTGLAGGLGCTLSVGLYDFVFYRFLAGMAFDNCFMMIYILVLEYVGPEHRTLMANMSVALYFGSCCVMLPWLAYWLKNWRTLAVVTSMPMVAAFAVPFVVPESARWLASVGRIEKAVSILRRFEKVNGTKIPEEVLENFIKSSGESRHNETMMNLLASRPLRLMMVFNLILYMTGALVYDVLVRMSESLGMDFFVTFTLVAATEIPSNAMIGLCLDRCGRKPFTYVPMFTSGVLALIASFVPRGLPVVILATIARFTVILAFNGATQWVTEVLPTCQRACGSSVIHISGYFATLMSPSIVYSGRFWQPLPLVALTIAGLVGGLVAMLLPETRGQPMPQTIADSEHLYYEHSFCGKREERIKHQNDSIQTLNAADGKEKPPTGHIVV